MAAVPVRAASFRSFSKKSRLLLYLFLYRPPTRVTLERCNQRLIALIKSTHPLQLIFKQQITDNLPQSPGSGEKMGLTGWETDKNLQMTWGRDLSMDVGLRRVRESRLQGV